MIWANNVVEKQSESIWRAKSLMELSQADLRSSGFTKRCQVFNAHVVCPWFYYNKNAIKENI